MGLASLCVWIFSLAHPSRLLEASAVDEPRKRPKAGAYHSIDSFKVAAPAFLATLVSLLRGISTTPSAFGVVRPGSAARPDR